MTKGFHIAAWALSGALAVMGPAQQLRAATSSTLDILPDDPPAPVIVDVGRVRPLAQPAAEPAKVAPGGNPLWSVPLSVLTATQTRPIFSASRRAPQPAVVAPTAAPVAAAAPPPVEERLTLGLIGAVVGDGDAIAILLDRSNQKIIRLRPGDSHNGWQVTRVEAREVTFSKSGRDEVLTIQRQENPASQPVAGMPPPVGGDPGVPGYMVPGGQRTNFAPFVPRQTPKNGEPDGL